MASIRKTRGESHALPRSICAPGASGINRPSLVRSAQAAREPLLLFALALVPALHAAWVARSVYSENLCIKP